MGVEVRGGGLGVATPTFKPAMNNLIIIISKNYCKEKMAEIRN